MKTIDAKINNIIGQLLGIKKMLGDDKDCIEVLTQLKAAKSALAGIMENVVETGFEECIKKLSQKDKLKLKQIKKELVKI